MAQQWGGDATWRLDGGQHPHEANYLKLDISKARNRLGWHPCWDLEATLRSIVAWHKAWMQKQDMREICLAQIEEYMGSMNKGLA